MSFKTSVKLDSPIFKDAARRRALSSVVSKNAKEFKRLTQVKMVNSPHTGAIAGQKSGAGYSRGSQRSRQGERPQRQSGNLERNIKDRKTSELSASVYVDSSGAPYGEILVEKLGRVIMSEQDISEADTKFNREISQKVKELL